MVPARGVALVLLLAPTSGCSICPDGALRCVGSEAQVCVGDAWLGFIDCGDVAARSGAGVSCLVGECLPDVPISLPPPAEDPEDATGEEVARFWAYFSTEYGSVYLPNTSITRAATTVGRTIFLPFVPGEAHETWPLWAQVETCVHEHVHVRQWAEETSFATLYLLSPNSRFTSEVVANLAAEEVEVYHLGNAWTAQRAEEMSGYMLSDVYIIAARSVYESVERGIGRGITYTEQAQKAKAWFDANAPWLYRGPYQPEGEAF